MHKCSTFTNRKTCPVTITILSGICSPSDPKLSSNDTLSTSLSFSKLTSRIREPQLTQFERGISESLETVIQREMAKYYTQQDYDGSSWQNKQLYKDRTTKMKNLRCFNCNEDGHYIRDCPKEKRSPYHKENRSGFIRNNERSQNQTEESLNC
ncbi:unnamed protein product [Mytilus edulis]|uniref:CCHC-type domain-containing protein n=1 Tax=Mytilus edulis TaxID=6550 RepID=A0A8S3U8Q0_MYTED|nr:unnamed protein product [Mytilus edulis]